MLRIEWSTRKNRVNILKHGVDFEEAKSVFDDPMQLTESDRIIRSMRNVS